MNSHIDYLKPKPLLPLLLVILAIVSGGALLSFRASLERWAAQGDAKMQYQLARCYFYGIRVNQNDSEAAKWFQLAANRGHAKAQTALGAMYAQGAAVHRNYREAVKWYRKAADQGLAAAQNQLGMMYAQGKGVPQDLEEAGRWFSLAASQGCEAAAHNLKFIAAARPSYFERLATNSGKTFEKVTIQKVESDSFTITYQPHSGGFGVARLEYKDLPKQLQDKYGYDPGQTTHLARSTQLAVVVLQTL